MDGPHLLWTAPHVLTPLVSGRFRSTGMRVGVNSAAQSDVRMGVKEGRVEVRVPVAAVDGHVKVRRHRDAPAARGFLIPRLFRVVSHGGATASRCRWSCSS